MSNQLEEDFRNTISLLREAHHYATELSIENGIYGDARQAVEDHLRLLEQRYPSLAREVSE